MKLCSPTSGAIIQIKQLNWAHVISLHQSLFAGAVLEKKVGGFSRVGTKTSLFLWMKSLYSFSTPFNASKVVSWRLSRCANLPQIRFWAELETFRTANRITEWILRFELITIFRVIVRWSHRWGRLGEIIEAPTSEVPGHSFSLSNNATAAAAAG